jgi:hypothetical protein
MAPVEQFMLRSISPMREELFGNQNIMMTNLINSGMEEGSRMNRVI